MNQPVPVRFVPHPASLCLIGLGHFDRRLEEFPFRFRHALAAFQYPDVLTILPGGQVIANGAGGLRDHGPDHRLTACKILVIAETYRLFRSIRKAFRVNAAPIAISRRPHLRPEIDCPGQAIDLDIFMGDTLILVIALNTAPPFCNRVILLDAGGNIAGETGVGLHPGSPANHIKIGLAKDRDGSKTIFQFKRQSSAVTAAKTLYRNGLNLQKLSGIGWRHPVDRQHFGLRG